MLLQGVLRNQCERSRSLQYIECLGALKPMPRQVPNLVVTQLSTPSLRQPVSLQGPARPSGELEISDGQFCTCKFEGISLFALPRRETLSCHQRSLGTANCKGVKQTSCFSLVLSSLFLLPHFLFFTLLLQPVSHAISRQHGGHHSNNRGLVLAGQRTDVGLISYTHSLNLSRAA